MGDFDPDDVDALIAQYSDQVRLERSRGYTPDMGGVSAGSGGAAVPAAFRVVDERSTNEDLDYASRLALMSGTQEVTVVDDNALAARLAGLRGGPAVSMAGGAADIDAMFDDAAAGLTEEEQVDLILAQAMDSAYLGVSEDPLLAGIEERALERRITALGAVDDDVVRRVAAGEIVPAATNMDELSVEEVLVDLPDAGDSDPEEVAERKRRRERRAARRAKRGGGGMQGRRRRPQYSDESDLDRGSGDDSGSPPSSMSSSSGDLSYDAEWEAMKRKKKAMDGAGAKPAAKQKKKKKKFGFF